MNNFLLELTSLIENNKEKIEKLLKIDNSIMESNYKYEDFYNDYINYLKKYKESNIDIDNDTLFITEGNPIITIDILNKVKYSNNKIIIFINQEYVAINKWLIYEFNNMTNKNIILDINNNYNKYINNKNLNIIPFGDIELIEEVKESLNEN